MINKLLSFFKCQRILLLVYYGLTEVTHESISSSPRLIVCLTFSVRLKFNRFGGCTSGAPSHGSFFFSLDIKMLDTTIIKHSNNLGLPFPLNNNALLIVNICTLTAVQNTIKNAQTKQFARAKIIRSYVGL